MSSARWGIGRRVAFRFGIIVGILLVFPFPLDVIPKLDRFASLLGRPLEWATSWFARDVLGLGSVAVARNGSGDRLSDYVQLLLIVLLAVLGTLVWSVLDRARPGYPRLAACAHVVLRYVVAWAMLSYGFAKILRSQFPDLIPGTLDQRVGDISPMRLVWTFMSYSAPYTVFAGLGEAVGGVLLLWRRTATLGALLVAVVMTNVVMLNFCYDVPVKIYSTQLLIMALLIVRPSARRLVSAALGRATAEVPPPARMSARWERAALAAKLVFLASVACDLYLQITAPDDDTHVHELYGTWVVDSFVLGGVEHPPLTTDGTRWRNLSANPHGLWLTTMTGQRSWALLVVDAAHKTIKLTPDTPSHLELDQAETWAYTLPAPDHLVIDAVHHGKPIHVALHLEPDGLLLTRGFHWVNEVPFNR